MVSNYGADPRSDGSAGVLSPYSSGLVTALTSTEVWARLCALPPYEESAVLQISAKLRQAGLAPDLVAAMLTQSRLRTKAHVKFGSLADQMLFTVAGLEQASRSVVAAAHAQRYLVAGVTKVADLTCGIGADSLAFAEAGIQVLATDIDPETAALAAWNLRQFPAAKVVCGDGLTTDFAANGVDGLYADPARRQSGGKRIFDPTAYAPPLDAIIALRTKVEAVGIKIGPGISHQDIPADAEAQWVSVDGDVVECGLWFGTLARQGPGFSALLFRTGTTGGRSWKSMMTWLGMAGFAGRLHSAVSLVGLASSYTNQTAL